MDITYRRRKLPQYKALGKEVVKILDERPHLLLRLEVSGEYFPHRDAPPFVMLQRGETEFIKDLFTEVSPDNQMLLGYLRVDLPTGGSIVFGYGDEIWGTVPGEFNMESVARLDRERLPENLVIVDADFMRRRK
jgi:hypothetical protein